MGGYKDDDTAKPDRMQESKDFFSFSIPEFCGYYTEQRGSTENACGKNYGVAPEIIQGFCCDRRKCSHTKHEAEIRKGRAYVFCIKKNKADNYEEHYI